MTGPQSQQLFNQALAFHRAGQLADAERFYLQRLAIDPASFAANHMLGVLRFQQGRNGEALELIGAALKAKPGNARILLDYANVQFALGRQKEALESYDKVLVIKPDYAEAHYNLGLSLWGLKRFEEALVSYDRALAIKPDYVEAQYNLGITLQDLTRLKEALASYDRVLAIRPDHVGALINRGNVLFDGNRFDEALASYDKALKIDPNNADALNGRGNGLNLKRFDEALASFDRALAVEPGHPGAFSGLADTARNLCDWQRTAKIADEIQTHVASRKSVIAPLVLLGYSDDAALQRECAKHYIDYRIPVRPPSLWDRSPHRRSGKIRIAYMSSDFRQHPVAFQVAELLERHDRSRFEWTGISLGHDDGSAIRARIIKAFDGFHDLRSQSDAEAANFLKDLELDILVDLNGHTQNSRFGILARRPAPVQVNYLGYAGTMGADFVDYVIADKFILPMEQQRFFAEKIVHLPDCYLVNDSTRPIGMTPTRAEAGLPDQGFVFCCFNNVWKITAPIFDVWMRLLQAVPGSMLWLKDGNDGVKANLRREAAARGVDPQRLVFAARLALDMHLARHRLADLFLDTFPYNAHTTASDALWSGLPVVTCAGESFVSRVAASQLHAIGLPELVADNLEGYEALAFKLARDETLLQSLRRRLEDNRLNAPLFDTDRFRRHMEAAYTTMWKASQRGAPPESFSVACS